MRLVVFTGLVGLIAAPAPIHPFVGSVRDLVHCYWRWCSGCSEHVVGRRYRRDHEADK